MLTILISLLLMTAGISQEALEAQETANGVVAVLLVHALITAGVVAQYRMCKRDTNTREEG